MRSGVSYPLQTPTLALAPARTNLVQRSQEFDNAWWSKNQSSITPDVMAFVDGTVTMDKMVEDTSVNVGHRLDTSPIAEVVAGSAYTYSKFAKAGERTSVRFQMLNRFSGTATFDLVNGVVSATTGSCVATIQNWGGGIYRCAITEVAASSGAGIVRTNLVNATGSVSYTGDGVSGLYLGGAQFEQSSIATALIPTSGSTVTTAPAVDANYPLSNLADLLKPRKPATWTSTKTAHFTFTLPAAVAMQFFAFVHHNAPAGAKYRIVLFSDNNPDVTSNYANAVYDSAMQDFWPTGAPNSLYAAVRPFVLAAPVTARSGWIQMDRQFVDSLAFQLGGFAIGSWVEWSDHAVDRTFGLKNQAEVFEMPNGIDHVMEQFSPRIWQGSRELVTPADLNTWRDFQKAQKTNNPFVFVYDADDSATWLRQCFLARNATLSPPMHREYGAGKIAFDFMEHLR